MKNKYADNAELTGDLSSMIGKVQNLQYLANGENLRNTTTNSTFWEHEMTDEQALAESYASTGTKSDFEAHGGGLPFGEVFSEANRGTMEGSDVIKAPSISQFVTVPGSPPIIIEDNPLTKQYTVYDKSGMKSDQFGYADADEKGYGLSSRQTLALGSNGYAGSWLINPGRRPRAAKPSRATASVRLPQWP